MEGGRGVGSGDWTRHAHEGGAQAEPRPAGCRRLRAPAPCRRARVRGRCRAPPVRWPPARASPPRRGGASHWGCRNGGHRLDARARPPAAPLPPPACRARAGRRPPMPRGPSAAPSRGRVEEGAAYARSPRPPAIGGSPGAAAAATPPRATCWEPPLPAKKGYKKRGDRARRVAVRAPRPSCSTCTYTTLCTGGEKRDTRWDAYATKDKNTQGETTIDKTKTTHERTSLKGWVERRKTPGQANTSSWSASTASTPPSSPSTAAKLRKCVGRWASS